MHRVSRRRSRYRDALIGRADCHFEVCHLRRDGCLRQHNVAGGHGLDRSSVEEHGGCPAAVCRRRRGNSQRRSRPRLQGNRSATDARIRGAAPATSARSGEATGNIRELHSRCGQTQICGDHDIAGQVRPVIRYRVGEVRGGSAADVRGRVRPVNRGQPVGQQPAGAGLRRPEGGV